ncbi:type II toxin-antitoxin system RelB/DinJ family antitoxin [Vibrio algarum]|uniref:Type II toxin-antitoxin system RelB/DinJ family antitoxin n=1 Tax=Vibrio algarum TaxID=3020714 RepID=A0ABT4YMV8_9VIBR|nr:type II toxin-antitoxin system RelB/DinJ family antitoxin [Vibrio sp. KJ40-1]MDB1122399.1 type II toxin-antitoxin system RelB/DinJ family antitoxin [Vibrio sp. KJ40-1]
MDTRVQFRINEEIKSLAQKAIERKGGTLSDVCRKLAEDLAREQRQFEDHDSWLTSQINAAFDKYERGEAKFHYHKEAEIIMEERKNKIRDEVL